MEQKAAVKPKLAEKSKKPTKPFAGTHWITTAPVHGTIWRAYRGLDRRTKNTRCCHRPIPDHSMEDPSPVGRSEQELTRLDISFREQLLKARELRIQLTLRPWPIAGPRR